MALLGKNTVDDYWSLQDFNQIDVSVYNSLKFFKSQEILAGKSLCDLYLTNPNRINIALMNLKHDKVDAQCSIVEQHVADMPRLMKERLI